MGFVGDYIDPRKAAAHAVFEDVKEWQTLIHKTTRAGATTSLLVESLDRYERFLCIVPTNRIATKTIVRDVKLFTERIDPNLVRIPANHSCKLNQQMIEEFPDLEFLPVLPLADKCEKCEFFDECYVTDVLRNPNADGFVLTYSKLYALILAAKSRPSTHAGKVLRVISKTRNVILDEVHELQFGKLTSLTVHDNTGYFSLDKYIPLMSDFPSIRKIIAAFSLIISDPTVQNAIFEVHGETEDSGFYSRHIRKILPNPSPEAEDDGKENRVNLIVGTYSEIIELTKNRKRYHLSLEDVLDLYKLLSISLNPRVAIHGIRDGDVVKVQLSEIDIYFLDLLRSFITAMEKDKKRILLTSATIGSFDYGKLFEAGMRPRKYMFGENGDPLNTNNKMLILADSYRLHAKGRNSIYNKRNEIISKIRAIVTAYGGENCLIVTLNKKEAEKLQTALKGVGIEHEVTYYKSTDLMGVSATQRVMIAVGLAKKPVNSYDVITNSVEESRTMLAEAEHFDSWQAWSRVKDPDGKEKSVVFALGCTVEECEALTTYGFNRKVEIEPYERNQKKHVNVSIDEPEISKPLIKKTLNFEEMLTEGFLFKQSKNGIKNNENLLYTLKYRTFLPFSLRVLDSPESLIELLLNRDDAYGLQIPLGSYIKKDGSVSSEVIKKHLAGELTLGFYTHNQESVVKWLCFDIDSHALKGKVETAPEIHARNEKAESDCERMCNYLKLENIPYLLEKSGSPHSYHIWVFLEPVDGRKARYFGKKLEKEAGIDCEVFPKQGTVYSGKYGNLVKVPLATHQKHKTKSLVQVNGEFVSSFENLEVGILDISDLEVPERQTPAVALAPVTTMGTVKPGTPAIPALSKLPVQAEVRPCIAAALQQQLTGGAGNFMRVAVVREYYNAGNRDPEKLAMMFRNQNDYSHEKSLYHVRRILESPFVHIKCATLREKGGAFVDCSECRYRHSYVKRVVDVSKTPPASFYSDPVT